MKIIVTGCKGQLGTEIIKQLREGRSEIGPIPEKLLNATVIPVDLPELDIANYKMVDDFIRRQRPDVIINCAAYTNVDGCEVNHDAAYKANAIGPRNLAQAATKTGARLVHVSTDYVFSGRENGGIAQDEATLPGPISAYGSTKLMGEKYVEQFCHRHFIVRTAWLYSYYGKTLSRPSSTRARSLASWKWSTTSAATRPTRWIWPTRFYSSASPTSTVCTTAPARASAPGMISPPRSSACPVWTLPWLPAPASSTRKSTRKAPTAPSGAPWTTGCSAAPSATRCAIGKLPWPASLSTGMARMA